MFLDIFKFLILSHATYILMYWVCHMSSFILFCGFSFSFSLALTGSLE